MCYIHFHPEKNKDVKTSSDLIPITSSTKQQLSSSSAEPPRRQDLIV